MGVRDKARDSEVVGNSPEVLGVLGIEGWSLLFDMIQDGVSVHSRDGTIRLANRTVHEAYSLELGDLLGRSCDDAFHRHELNCPHVEVVASGRGAEVEQSSGDDRHFRVRLEPLIGNDGSVTGYVRLMRDITERVQAQRALLRAERFATLGQMISGIAHDVGSPLSIISGYSEYLLMRTVPDGPGHRELSTILAQTRRIADFIKHLLDLARPGQPREDAIGLKDFLDELFELMAHHFRKLGVESKLTIKVGSPLVYGDSPRLRQALFNLLLNASQRLGAGSELLITLDAAPGAQGPAAIVISGRTSDGGSYDFARSFSDFLAGDQDRLLDLGLTLTREILREFGARIEIVGAEGSLAIHLPVRA